MATTFATEAEARAEAERLKGLLTETHGEDSDWIVEYSEIQQEWRVRPRPFIPGTCT
jgi:hypothetical protein